MPRAKAVERGFLTSTGPDWRLSTADSHRAGLACPPRRAEQTDKLVVMGARNHQVNWSPGADADRQVPSLPPTPRDPRPKMERGY